ncbi:MAG: ATP-dependent sacrificial sulfur transferase LarE [Nocardioidaceae bacterium]
MQPTLVVGFDLDMTLLDTRPGIRKVWDELSAITGVSLDSELIVSRLGPPLSHELTNWVAPERVPELIALYRELYPDHAIEPALLLPGAVEALQAVRDRGGSALVVTAKSSSTAQLHIDHLALGADELVGGLWGEGKAEALLAHGAVIYVGDHVHDMAGARAAGAVAVGVTTGPCSRDELTAAGADVVLTDLTELPGWLDDYLLTTRLAALDARLHELGSLLVAFSGGADSAFLLAAAVRSLGPDKVVAATALSDSLPQSERDPARAFCRQLGVRHLTPTTHEMDRAGYRANAGDRCYFCKAELVDVLRPVAVDLGIAHVATGTNADDALAGFRPGIRAAFERDAVTPLLDAGLTKSQIRQASLQWGLPTWDKPAAACLSSRIAYGVEVTPTRLARVERAEVAVRLALADDGHEIGNVRVRDLGDEARIELDLALVGALARDAAATQRVLAAAVGAGFSAAFVDPAGFRSGAMNELLADPARYR